MTKRRKLVLESVILTLGFLATQFVEVRFRYWAILLFGVGTYFLTALFLKEDLKKIDWLVVLLPPVCYVVFASLFYFLLPQKILIRILILILFGIGIYALLLTENIFSIASSFQAIQLLRAAQAVGFLITLIIAFFGYNAIFSFKAISWINASLVFLISLPLILSSLWSVSLEERLTKRVVFYSLALSFLTGQMAFFLSFWPLTITTASLFLVSFLYVNVGITQSYFTGRLFRNTLREFLRVGIIIFFITYFLARWR